MTVCGSSQNEQDLEKDEKRCSPWRYLKGLEGPSSLSDVILKYLSLCLIGWISPSCSFFALHDTIHPRATTEFLYRYHDPERAQIFLSFQLETTSRAKEVSDLISALEKLDMKAVDISDDEMAKSHARYMIGGCKQVPNERLFRFGEPMLSCRTNFIHSQRV